ncbi:MAG: hypothetical protein R2698_00795 [Microthrixaceae bacterium]
MRALVSRVGSDGEAGVGTSDEVRVNLEVPDEDAARQVVDAHAKGHVTLMTAGTVALGGGSSR